MDTVVYQYIEQCLKDALGSSFDLLNVRALSGGCINAASALDTTHGPFFVKWNKSAAADLFLREADGLKELAKADSELIIPEVVLAKTPENQFPGMLVTEYLEAASNRSEQDEVLGRGLAQLHKFTAQAFGFESDTYCGATLQDNSHKTDWVAFYSENRLAHLLKMIREKRELSATENSRYEQLLQKLPSIIGHNPAPALNHGDLWSGNYLYTNKGPALIDPAIAYADRELDLALTTMFGGFSDSFWEAYQETYPLPADWQSRNPVYMLYHYLNHYYLFGGGYGTQALQIANRYL